MSSSEPGCGRGINNGQQQQGVNNNFPVNTEHASLRAVREKNRNLAIALGIAPYTIRNNEQTTLTIGWAWPVTPSIRVLSDSNKFDNKPLHNAAAHYPDRTTYVRIPQIRKKGCILFLKSHGLPLRKFVYKYLDCWRPRSKSYNPEGLWYVHSSKFADMCAPYSLLLEAARRWCGPNATLSTFGEGDCPLVINWN